MSKTGQQPKPTEATRTATKMDKNKAPLKSQSRFNLDWFSMYCITALGGVCIWLFSTFQSIHERAEMFAKANPNYNWPHSREFLSMLAYAVIISVVRSVFVKFFTDPVKTLLKDCPEKDVRAAKVTQALFKVIFYVSIVTWAYLLIKDTEFLGPQLGGSGDFKNIWRNFPYYSYPEGLTTYYMFSLAYHVQSLFFHVLITERRNDYLEMLLHHTVTCFLLYISFVLNYVRVGVLVTFVHDISDIFIYGAKFLVDLKWEKIQIPYYGLLMTSLAYTRLYVYPFYVIQWGAYYCEEQAKVEIRGRDIGLVMLFMLLFLHIYWFCILLKIGFSKIFKGKRMEDEFCVIDK
eukprot:CAMPEP_0115021162 /NCGR_PEP_ID=MMETSP0216-20121206/30699_1 /TAXON_ID=223996 /ORGANISM="Protocruzia adherens, Strain Boccale" /LENGTH=346 /DNA_ID=CAMNT_0002393419 /DNA_START=67 /DNA_END=1104 /DNA_ORIENTATION=-